MARSTATLERRVVKVADASRMYGIDRDLITEAIRRGDLAATQLKPGTTSPYRIDAGDLHAWYERTFQPA